MTDIVSTSLEFFLPIWSAVFCVSSVALILSGKLNSWPLLARVGFSLTIVGVLADIALSGSVGRAPLFVYLLVKDIGLGLIVASFFYTAFTSGKSNEHP